MSRILTGIEKTDYLLFKASTHRSAIWYLAGVTFVSSAFGPTIASGYELTGTADFNGDGSPDYVLYNASTRQTAIWYMNNSVLAGGASVPLFRLPGTWSRLERHFVQKPFGQLRITEGGSAATKSNL